MRSSATRTALGFLVVSALAAAVVVTSGLIAIELTGEGGGVPAFRLLLAMNSAVVLLSATAAYVAGRIGRRGRV